jgi:hypothetical protein
MQFAHADRNHDGELNIDELAAFVHAISCPESDQLDRTLRTDPT